MGKRCPICGIREVDAETFAKYAKIGLTELLFVVPLPKVELHYSYQAQAWIGNDLFKTGYWQKSTSDNAP